MTLLLGDHDCLVMQSKDKKGRHRTTRFWAERGLIHCEDSKEGYTILSVAQFMQQVKGLNDMLGNRASNRDTGFDVDLRKSIQANVEMACRIAKKAQEQGMPDDPTCRTNYAVMRPRSFYMGGGKSM
jgi:hypothetical protein